MALVTKSTTLLESPIEYLKGVGSLRADALKKELNIHTFKDLLYFYPFRYVDRTRIYKIKEVNAEMPFIQICGKITHVEITGPKRQQRMMVDFADDTGRIELIWFQGITWVSKNLRPNVEYIVFGKPSVFRGILTISHPSMEEMTPENLEMVKGLQPVYSSTETLKSKSLDSTGIMKLERTLLSKLEDEIKETMPTYMLEKLRLMPRKEALKNIHLPSSIEKLNQAQFRLKFEELFYMQLRLLRNKSEREVTIKGFVFSKVDKYVNDFYRSYLPFPLTEAQKRVIREIRTDMGSGKQMNRLLQGDVGSGKTLVASAL